MIPYTLKALPRFKRKISRKLYLEGEKKKTEMTLCYYTRILTLSLSLYIRIIYRRSFIDFQIWDFPGQINFFDPAYDSLDIFESVGALIFVIDAQDDYSEALSRLFYTVTSAYKVNPNITFEVLLHKVDGLSDDYKIGKSHKKGGGYSLCY